jgi:hypothetical protein
VTARKRTPGQLPLTAGRRSRGVVERAAGTDLRLLTQLELIAPGSKALEAAYRQLARELDRAEAERDRYGTINAARELLRVRAALAPTTAGGGEHDPDAFVAELSAAIRDAEKP